MPAQLPLPGLFHNPWSKTPGKELHGNFEISQSRALQGSSGTTGANWGEMVGNGGAWAKLGCTSELQFFEGKMLVKGTSWPNLALRCHQVSTSDVTTPPSHFTRWETEAQSGQ